jgi:very-long-chain (3R)-3-hydroxyacyl-CoA dehydratase
MVLAWSVAEVVRYPFYALSLLGLESSVLLWLRYTLFLVLYPIGAVSEAALSFQSLPKNLPLHKWGSGVRIRAALILLWGPGMFATFVTRYISIASGRIEGRIHAYVGSEKKSTGSKELIGL